jgi:DNA-directed RNA polymerase specialized sigma24 family protein
MPPTTRNRILAIEQINTEWMVLGRSPHAVRVLHQLASRDEALHRLVHGDDSLAPPLCPTPFDLVEHMRRASGRRGREDAAALIRLMLREAGTDGLVARFIVQALLPGLVNVAGKLSWGDGGDWVDGADFFSELLSTAWEVVADWSGQDRRYAVLDLLSAIRCRLRRQLFRAKRHRHAHDTLTPEVAQTRLARPESDLELLAHTLIELRQDGMRAEEIEVLYAQHVLGYSISELASVSGRDRRALYARRDRGLRRLCA